jgi:hypothetical protein
VQPDERPEGRIQDDRDRHVEATPSVQPEIPGADLLAVDPLRRAEVQLNQPAFDGPGVRAARGAQSALDPRPVVAARDPSERAPGS